MESLTSGTFVGAGSFRCQRCGYVLTLAGSDALTRLSGLRRPGLRARLAVQHRAPARRRHARRAATAALVRARARRSRGAAGAGARAASSSPASTSATEDDGELRTVALTREWTRIGRSLAADVRFDDPTVSRRHALIVRQPDGVRVLDDRSLNGVFVNGERVEGRVLEDGDEIIVGRYRLSFLERGARARDATRRRPAAEPLRARRTEGHAARARGAARSIAVMAHTIAVLSQKGGTGKTTAVRTLTDVLRRSGVRTLAIDLDPQGNLSDYFDLPPDVEPTIADVLAGRASAAEAIHEDIIPANLSLAEAELMLGGKMGRELTLRRALARIPEDYELILIDCPPSLGLLTVNALVAADHALITAEAQYFALQGVEQAMEVVELARDSLNPELSLLGVLLNLADMRTVHSREALVVAEGALRRAGLRHGHPRLDRLRRVGRARALDPRPPARPRRRLPRAGRRGARAPARPREADERLARSSGSPRRPSAAPAL